MNRENLLKLANYLAALPEGYKHFEMNSFSCTARQEPLECDQVEEVATICGAVACAVGHGPAAGIPVTDDVCKKNERVFNYALSRYEYKDVVDWFTYSEKNFTGDDRAWQFMFGGAWSPIDNTPQGAAKRIRYVLDHGVPHDFDEDDGDDWTTEMYDA